MCLWTRCAPRVPFAVPDNRVELIRRRLPLRVPYAITGHHIDAAEVVALRLRTPTGLEAYGAAAPSKRLTGEHAAGVYDLLQRDSVPWLETAALDRPLAVLGDLPETVDAQPAARAVLDIALHDLHAKQQGAPLHRWLGSRPDEILTSVTIGICDVDETVRQGTAHVASGFACLKLKVGEELELDIERVCALRDAVGSGVRIRVDANQGYDADGACRFLDAVAPARIELLEQPTPAADLDALKSVTRYAGKLPIMADESVVSVEDARRVLEQEAASAINIKLMKCGGLGPAREILQAAREHGVRCMLGCMDESRISMAAAAHLALSDDSVWWADLDGHLDLAEDLVSGGINIAAGYVTVPEAPGLGVIPAEWNADIKP